MTKKDGEEYTKIAEIKLVKQKGKKKTYDYGRIEIRVRVEWVGYKAKVIVSMWGVCAYKSFRSDPLNQ